MLKEREKLIAFVLLLLAVLGLVILASTFDRGASNDIVTQGKLRIIDSSVTGLLTVLGMAAQALFKITDAVKISNKPNEPVPTTDGDGTLPESEQIK